MAVNGISHNGEQHSHSDEEGSSTGFHSPGSRDSFSRRGSNRNWAETGRTKLQKERQRINHQINKEIQIRAGAERLFRATNNRKQHEKIAAELSVVNANLQLLSEEMAELNTSVHVYQEETGDLVPLIPLGLKETVDLDFSDSLTEFLVSHYHVTDLEEYDRAIGIFMSLRNACRSPSRDENGISLLLEYVHTLSLIERRFFTPVTGIKFQWYDSLIGIPCIQKSVAFEKASTLFNMGSLYTQIGARQRAKSMEGLSSASAAFQKAAGIFQFIANSFNNAPSMDLKPETLRMLVSLMLVQSQECLYDLSLLSDRNGHLIHAQEAAQVSKGFTVVHDAISAAPVKQYVPYSWISMVLVKVEFYKAKSHFHTGLALADYNISLAKIADILEVGVLAESFGKENRKNLARNHVRQATLLFEECIRIHRMCRLLRKVDMLLSVLRNAHDRSLELYQRLEDEENFAPASTPPGILAKAQKISEPIAPNFTQVRVKDPFRDLGPLHVFNASNEWSKPKLIHMIKSGAVDSYGFSVRGSSPVSVTEVESGSIAEENGLKKGDIITKLHDENVTWEIHEKLVEKMRQHPEELILTVVTPFALAPGQTINRHEVSKIKMNGHAKKK
ncbi:rhophilin-2-like [Paramacrobiotus metropolitanus]|uniref:rhophilin-2-like n=1 Tax=Paramacrobiotus metropolitanus TaxID=2943436 RepID=UPI002445B449|nr:rhophilin-2-like [Paramacrobiotus metropolitanus]